MTNTTLLKEKIAQSGLKLTFIAQYMDLSRTGLYHKINNRRPFNQYEIDKLCQVLHIKSMKEIEQIFFARHVDHSSTEECL